MTAPDFSRRIPQLDGLRGVAIAMVLVFHYVSDAVAAGAPRFVNVLIRPTSLCWSGVDLFFVLSGFLIGGILLDARESANYFRVFYRRRLFRIFPLYFAFMAVAFLAAHFAGPTQSMLQPAIAWPACMTFCQNFWIAFHNDMAAAINPTWSLAVEEQFYLVIPAVIYFVRPARRLIWVLAGGIALAPLIRLAIFLVNPRLTTAIRVLLPCRMDTLLLGAAAAYFLRQPGAWEFVRAHRRRLWTAIELLTGVCALFLIRASMTDPLTMLVGYDCLALLYVCILVASLVDEGLAGVLRAKWLMGLGGIAYGVYLIHQLVFGAVFALLRGYPNSGPISTVIALVLTIVLANISWEWFEKPFVRFGQRERYEPSKSPLSQSSDIAGFTIASSTASVSR